MYPDSEYLPKIQKLLRSKGLHDSYSQDTFLLHLHSRMRSKRCLTYQEYLSVLKEDIKEFSFLKKELSINVTSFFRDLEVFELFRTILGIYIKEIINRGKTSRIRIWSAGCANGSEHYSISIIIHQELQHKLARYNVKIYATDINADILSTARTGKYPNSVYTNLPENDSRKFFIKTSNSHYRLQQKVKKLLNLIFWIY